jgi:hypothetical protein
MFEKLRKGQIVFVMSYPRTTQVVPFRPVCPVEPISAFYGQDGQEDFARAYRLHSGDGSVAGPSARFVDIVVDHKDRSNAK